MLKVFIDYNEYGFLLRDLTDHLLKFSPFDCIVAPPKGALPIAVHLSHHLDINQIVKDIPPELTRILIVDDIIDTGHTINNLFLNMKEGQEIYTCSLFYKKHSKFKPNHYIRKTNDWIVFPWERLEEKPNREKYKDL